MEDAGPIVVGALISIILFAPLTALQAERKGYQPGPWVLYALCFPPIAFLHILLKEPKPLDPKTQETAQLAAGEMKTCPECAEPVRRAAQKCRYCGHQFARAVVRQVSPAAARTAERMRRLGG